MKKKKKPKTDKPDSSLFFSPEERFDSVVDREARAYKRARKISMDDEEDQEDL